jgi:hypothetical protein
MSLPTVTQTIVTPPVSPVGTTGSASAGGFPALDATGGTASPGSVSSNPITSLSSDLQNYLLQQQSQDDSAQSGKASDHHHHHGGGASGTNVDSPSLPGGGTSAVAA